MHTRPKKGKVVTGRLVESLKGTEAQGGKSSGIPKRIRQHFVDTQDGRLECKYCPNTFRVTNRIEMEDHLSRHGMRMKYRG